MKLEGKVRGMEIYSDPNVPKGKAVLLNYAEGKLRNYFEFDVRSPWQKFKDWFWSRKYLLALISIAGTLALIILIHEWSLG